MQFFYYHEVPFPPIQGHFKDHVTWSGDVMNNDGSITLNDVQFSFNGTYTCQARNPPDVHGYTSEIRLEVVRSGETSRRGSGFLSTSAYVPVPTFLLLFWSRASEKMKFLQTPKHFLAKYLINAVDFNAVLVQMK